MTKQNNTELYYSFRVTEFEGIGICPVILEGVDYSNSKEDGSIVKINDKKILLDMKNYLEGKISLPDYMKKTKPIDKDECINNQDNKDFPVVMLEYQK